MPRRKQDRPKRMQWEMKAQAERDSKDQDLSDAVCSEEKRSDSTTGIEPMSAASSSDDTFFTSELPSKCEDQDLPCVSTMESVCVEDGPLEHSDPSSRLSSPSASVKSDEAMETEDTPLDFSLKNTFSEKAQNSDQPLDLSLPQRRKSLDACTRTVKTTRLDTFHPTSPWGYCSPRSVPLMKSRPGGQLNGECGNSNLLSSLWLKKAASPTEDTAKHDGTDRFTPSPSLGAVPMETVNGPLSSPSPRFSAPSEHKQWSSSSVKASGASLCDSSRQPPREAHVKKSRFKTSKTLPPPSSPTSSSMTSPPYNSLKPGFCNGVLKSAVSLPRKLVRGQDVWLGKGAEQTRQILKCMWCGQSFKSLADMTTHMRVTRHYANIISQEKIVSWRLPEDQVSGQTHINGAVPLKVFDQPFPTQKEFGPHAKKVHDKDGTGKVSGTAEGRRRSTRERRKKSLPVRKLLELERQEQQAKRPVCSESKSTTPSPAVGDGQISCEECAEKVDAKDFVLHIKNCSRESRSDHSAPRPTSAGGLEGCSGEPGRPSVKLEVGSDIAKDASSPSQNKKSGCGSSKRKGTPSVLNAIEKLIEKSFEKEKKLSSSSGILQRLGIDEESCFSWQPTSPSRLSMMKAACDSSNALRTSPSVSSCYSHDSTDIRTDSERSLVPPAESCGDQVEISSCSSNGRSSVSTPGTLHSFPGRSGHEPLTPDTSDSASPPAPTETHPTTDPRPEAETPPKMEAEPEDSRYQDPGGTGKNVDEATATCSGGEEQDWDQDSCTLPEIPSPRNGVSPQPSDDSPHIARLSPATTSRDRDTPVPSQKSEQVIVESVNGNPLRELQKLLDKTEAHMSRTVLPAVPGSLLSLDWTSGSPGSVVACAFCDTSFTSRSAYRHHLGKTHFVNESDSSAWKGDEKAADSSASVKSSPDCSTDDGPHSKFLKYTELAKQLSSKYV